MIGKMLAHYEITSQLGKGGMGEVYQAKDLKLGRDVAIKVLPEEFAKDADRVSRFQREAKLLASLNHPNIAAIYGLEEFGGTNFLVLELVEGDTLAERIKAGPIPVEESLKLALQIAEALEAAHEKSVIHRDLKPANIKVTPEGKVKVLDFGLAKAYAGDQEVNLSNSPTLSSAATQQGLILGTAAYMSPEQAKGKAVDKRADVWAFGVVLYEMLTGRSVFAADDVSQTLARVLERQPDFSMLPPNLHPRIVDLLERCLEKEAGNRCHDIADVRIDIQKVLAGPGGVLAQPVTAGKSQSMLRTVLPWVAAVAITAIVAGLVARNLREPEKRQVMRFDYELPEGRQFSDDSWPVLAVSPDGRQFVYSTPAGLYLRSVNELAAKLVAGTEGSVQQPFFSPDGKWIGYFSVGDRQLKKISVNGGAPVTLCSVGQLVGAWWGADNTIVYGRLVGDIMRISDNGGTPESIIKPAPGPAYFPQMLPDKKSVLYTRISSPRTIMVQSLKSGEAKELFAGNYARYLPTGHIVYKPTDGSTVVFAVPFDLARFEVTGSQVPVVEDAKRYAISNSGTLVYIPGLSPAAAVDQRTLVWVDHNGKEAPLGAPLNLYRFPNISPDGTKVAVTVVPGGLENNDLWIWDLARRNLTRLTFERTNNLSPVWTPDGKQIAFFSGEANNLGIYWKAADGAGKDERLGTLSDRGFLPSCWANGGKVLVGVEMLAGLDIEMMSMEGGHARKPLLQGSYRESQPKISPDGRWMAYTSDESRRNEVYVRSFPDMNSRWQVSADGGDSPLWSPDGRELFYRNGDAVMAISVRTEPTFSIAGMPQILFRGTYVQATALEGTPWDISPDGKRFLMMKPAAPTTSEPAAAAPRPKINIVINWFEELKQRVPVK